MRLKRTWTLYPVGSSAYMVFEWRGWLPWGYLRPGSSDWYPYDSDYAHVFRSQQEAEQCIIRSIWDGARHIIYERSQANYAKRPRIRIPPFTKITEHQPTADAGKEPQ